MFKIFDGRDNFYQWDTNCRLVIEDATIREVHFCNRTDNCALVCETYAEDGLTLVDVPNILLQQAYKIHIYAYNGAQTKYDKCYDVRARSKPADYAYTETEVLTWYTISEKVDKTIKEVEAEERARQTEEYVRKTQEISRKNAETKRESNESARVEAEAARASNYNELSQLLTDLSAEATAAINDTKSATNRANEAAQSAYNNSSYANQAATYAEYYGGEAEKYAHQASQAADTAYQNADTAYYAANSANMAAEAANDAASKANKAADKANNAANNINGAFANALKGEARGAAVGLKDISPVAHTIEAKVKSKNLAIINEQELTGAFLTKVIYKGYINTQFVLSWNQDCASTNSASMFGVKDANNYEWLQYIGDNKTSGAHSAVIKPTDKEVEIQILNWTGCTGKLTNIQLEVGTTATEYAPYLPDLSAVKVKKYGKNLFNNDTSKLDAVTYAGVSAQTTRIGYELHLPAGQYTISAKYINPNNTLVSTTYIYTYVNNKNGEYIADALKYTTGKEKIDSYVITTDYIYPEFIYTINDGDVIYIVDANTSNTASETIPKLNNVEIQIECGTAATEYEPYIEPIEYAVSADGVVNGVSAIYPATTLVADTDGAVIQCEYNRDINKAFAELCNAVISLGGNI